MAKKHRRFVPHLFVTATCAAQVVPACAVEACGGDVQQTASGSDSGGGPIGVAVAAFTGGRGGAGGRTSTGGIPFSVGVSAFGGYLGMAGGAFTGGRGGAAGGVAAGGFGAGGFGMAGGAFTGGRGGTGAVPDAGVADAAFGSGGASTGGRGGTGGKATGGFGVGGFIVAAGAFGVAAGAFGIGSGGHASLDPEDGRPFGDASESPTQTKKSSVRRRRG